MAQIVRHNDKSLREWYKEDGGKEVKLRTSVPIISRLECGRFTKEATKERGISKSFVSRLWKQFQEVGNVDIRYSTGRL
ncbi:hypothetical protein TNCV_3375101 [Trichonephila clavipes]|nr:hypothetical protein TNCV_3375101 [Trichonephila clavipes]